jgi:hypothetical protein
MARFSGIIGIQTNLIERERPVIWSVELENFRVVTAKKQTKRKRKPDPGELRLETLLFSLRVVGGRGVELGGDDDFQCGGSDYIGGSELGFRVRAVWWLDGLWAVLRPFWLRRWIGASP